MTGSEDGEVYRFLRSLLFVSTGRRCMEIAFRPFILEAKRNFNMVLLLIAAHIPFLGDSGSPSCPPNYKAQTLVCSVC